MEYKFYSITFEILDDNTLKVFNTVIDYNTFTGIGTFENGILSEPIYTVVRKSHLVELIEWELKTKKSFDFYDKLAKKIQSLLDEKLNKK